MTGWQMYWLTRLDVVHGEGMEATMAVSLIFGALALIGAIIMKATGDEDLEKCVKVCRHVSKCLLPVGLICILFVAIIPSTKEMAAIIVVPKIVNNENAQELPENLVDLCNEWMKDKVKELKEK